MHDDVRRYALDSIRSFNDPDNCFFYSGNSGITSGWLGGGTLFADGDATNRSNHEQILAEFARCGYVEGVDFWVEEFSGPSRGYWRRYIFVQWFEEDDSDSERQFRSRNFDYLADRPLRPIAEDAYNMAMHIKHMIALDPEHVAELEHEERVEDLVWHIERHQRDGTVLENIDPRELAEEIAEDFWLYEGEEFVRIFSDFNVLVAPDDKFNCTRCNKIISEEGLCSSCYRQVQIEAGQLELPL